MINNQQNLKSYKLRNIENFCFSKNVKQILKKKKISDHSEIFFALQYIKTEQKLFLGQKFFVPEKKNVSLKKTSFENFITVVRKGGFQFLWRMVL